MSASTAKAPKRAKRLPPSERSKLTPPELGKSWGVDPNKVIGWIESGELRAINAATTTGGRPRYLIDHADIAAFEQRRAVAPASRPTPKRRKPADVIEFIK